MNRLAMIAVTCIFGFALAACGESTTKPATPTTTTAPAGQEQHPDTDKTKGH